MPFDPLTRKFLIGPTPDIHAEGRDRRSIAGLLKYHGSFRRLVEAYWSGRLEAGEERVIEDSTPKADLVGHKPCPGTANDAAIEELRRELTRLDNKAELTKQLVVAMHEVQYPHESAAIRHAAAEFADKHRNPRAHLCSPRCGCSDAVGRAIAGISSRPKSPYFNDGLE